MTNEIEDKQRFTQAAIRFAQSGGEVLMEYFGKEMQIRDKGVGNLVSEADLLSEQTIVELIRSEFPGHSVLAEERHASASGGKSLWIVDPLDGTNNFTHGIPHFAVSVAFYQDGQAQCGAVCNPAQSDLFIATRGEGASWNGREIHVSNEAALDQTLVATGFYYDRGDMLRKTLRSIEALFAKNIHGIRRFGTASLDLCSVASGQFGGFFEYHLSPCDFAAGRLIVEEAGGRVTNCEGKKLGTTASSVLATNGRLHAALLACLETVM
jgi:myo-inositol-1(or 4)-monophosphatase